MKKQRIGKIARSHHRGVRKCVWINSLIFRHFSFGRRAPNPRFVPVLAFPLEMVDSVENPRSSRSSREHHFPNSEMLDARIASALKKFISNSYFKKGVSLEEQRPKWKTDFFEEDRLLL